MKRCPTCNRTYTDPNLSFCVEDGTPLTTEVPEADAPYLPPGSYSPAESMPPVKQRRAWPWALGIFGAFVLGIVGLMIVAAILLPRMVRSRQGNLPVVVTTNEADEPANVEAPPPIDEDQVLAQLRDIENEWTVANLNADKQKLERILADDYVGPAAEGRLQGKREYIDTIRPDRRVDKWEFDDLRVHLSGDRATLTGKITYFFRDQQQAFDFTDKFVWRNGRWQATGSEVKPTE